MNQPPEEFIRVQEQALMDFGVACFAQAGLDQEHAELFTRLLVNSDLRGVRSHGSRNINGYCNAFEQGHANPRPDIRAVQQTAATAVLDGDGVSAALSGAGLPRVGRAAAVASSAGARFQCTGDGDLFCCNSSIAAESLLRKLHDAPPARTNRQLLP